MKALLKTLCVSLLILMASVQTSASSTPRQNGTLIGLESHTIVVDGVERHYALHTPAFAGDDAADMPLLIMLHPLVSSGRAMAALTQAHTFADEAGFIVVYPDAIADAWDDGRIAAGLYSPEPSRDDVGFLDNLIAHLAETANVDPDRVYLSGMDNGAGMAYRMACDASTPIAGIAIVSTSMWDYHVDHCLSAVRRPLDVLLFHGDRDVYYPVSGRMVPMQNGGRRVLPVAETVSFWATWNNCDPSSLRTYGSDFVTGYSDCDDEVRVLLYGVPGAGHHWLRTDQSLNNLGINANSILLSFFNDEDDWEVDALSATEAPRWVRSYSLYVPTSVTDEQPVPLIVALHGRTGTGWDMAYITEFNQLAETEGFVVVYPDGLDRQWNYVKGINEFPAYSHDDGAFFRDLVDDIALNLNVDRSRVYLAGLSNGGYMAFRQACESPDLFAAFASVVASAYHGLPEFCADVGEPIPFLMMNGRADYITPWEGFAESVIGYDDPIYISYPILDAFDFWAMYNGCSSTPEEQTLPVLGNSPGTEVLVATYSDCVERGALELYAVNGGGHNWTGVGLIPSEIGGVVNMDIHASEVIWEFFSRHSLPQ